MLPGVDLTSTKLQQTARERVRAENGGGWIPHSYKSVLPQFVSFAWGNLHGGIVDLHCLACSTNDQLFLLTAMTLDDSPDNKHGAI